MSEDNYLTVYGDKSVRLHDNGLRAGSLIEASVRSLSHRQAQNLMEKAAEEALRLEVKNREQLMDYVEGKKSALDHIDTWNMLDKGGRLTRHSVMTDIKTGAGTMRLESKTGATCFVASVAYDDPNHPDVMALRWYRDNVLKHSAAGRKFIGWYWRWGPKLAKVVGKSILLRRTSRFSISSLVRVLRVPG